MIRDLVMILPGTVGTSRNIVENLKDLRVSAKIIPIIKIEVDYEVVKEARERFSSGFRADLSVFTSKTSVKIVHDLIPTAWKYAKMRSLSIGPGTASLLRSLGAEVIDILAKHSSEGLIEFLEEIPKGESIALYCSRNVNPLLENFVKNLSPKNYVFKLYGIRESKDRIENIVKLAESNPSKIFLVILTSIQILRILSEDRRILSFENVLFSAISKRIVEEAERLNFPISHYSQTSRIDEYYLDLKRYVKNLLNSI